MPSSDQHHLSGAVMKAPHHPKMTTMGLLDPGNTPSEVAAKGVLPDSSLTPGGPRDQGCMDGDAPNNTQAPLHSHLLLQAPAPTAAPPGASTTHRQDSPMAPPALRYLPITRLLGMRRHRSTRRCPALELRAQAGGAAGEAALAMALGPPPPPAAAGGAGAGAGAAGGVSNTCPPSPAQAEGLYDTPPAPDEAPGRGRQRKRPFWMEACATAEEQAAYLADQQRRRASAAAAAARRAAQQQQVQGAAAVPSSYGGVAGGWKRAKGAAVGAMVGAGGGRCTERVAEVQEEEEEEAGVSSEETEDEAAAVALLALLGGSGPGKGPQVGQEEGGSDTDTEGSGRQQADEAAAVAAAASPAVCRRGGLGHTEEGPAMSPAGGASPGHSSKAAASSSSHQHHHHQQQQLREGQAVASSQPQPSPRPQSPTGDTYAAARAWLVAAGLLRSAGPGDGLDGMSAGLWLQWQAVLRYYAAGQVEAAMGLAYQLGAATGTLLNSCGGPQLPGTQ